jgi:Transposase family tnp2
VLSLDHHFKPILENVNPVLQVTFFLVVTCQVLLGVSRRGCSFMLQMLQYIINLTLIRLGPNLSQGDEKLLSGIPTDPRGIEKAFNLGNKNTIFAVCPKSDCHFNYEPTFHEGSPIPHYPATCNHREFRGGPKCGTPLVKPRRINGLTIHVPIKSFVAFSFKHWLGGMLARSGFEEKMDKAWVRSLERVIFEMKDIFDAEVLRNFTGLDGRHFSDGGEEGRYVFSLCIDYFNPLGNKQAGKKKSIGLVSMVCLNLPPEERYKPENMFLFGIIPGPNEPPLACFNHYLHILIEELLEFWFSGVLFSRTSTCYYGRVVRCALVCVVSDLLAARKVNGFAAIGHTQMCAICHCTRQQQDDLNDSFASLGNRRTGEEIRESAQLYLDAENGKERKDTVTTTGIRWSELYRLPYFDPSRMVVVDCMHNLFLGLVQEHFEILGIRMDNKKGKEPPALSINISTEAMSGLDKNERKSMDKLIETLESPMNKELESFDGYDMYFKRLGKLHKQSLKLVFESYKLKVNPTYTHITKENLNKPDFIHSILTWVSCFPNICVPIYTMFPATYAK